MTLVLLRLEASRMNEKGTIESVECDAGYEENLREFDESSSVIEEFFDKENLWEGNVPRLDWLVNDNG